jgi:ABC-2 type transport system ATP-binding protein
VVIINRGKIVADSKVGELKNVVSSENVITVEFEKDIEISQFQDIEGVIEVSKQSVGKYQIRSKPEVDVRAAIFRKAADQSWTLVGLKQEERSIENIFRELTGNKKEGL